MRSLNKVEAIRKYLGVHPATLVMAIANHKQEIKYELERERIEWEHSLSDGIEICGLPLLTCRRILRNHLELIDTWTDHLAWCVKTSGRL